MIRFLLSALVLLTTSLIPANAYKETAVQHVYKFKMLLRVPRVYDNTKSLGYRKYQHQKLQGTLTITYPLGEEGFANRKIEVPELVNFTHKDSQGNYITYKCTVDEYFILNLIGNNRTCKFIQPCITFSMIAKPSYAIGDKPTEDNSLHIQLSGDGSTSVLDDGSDQRYIRRLTGTVTGNLGCGCEEYGHTSPTRVADYFGPRLDVVHDVASVRGNFYLTYRGSNIIK